MSNKCTGGEKIDGLTFSANVMATTASSMSVDNNVYDVRWKSTQGQIYPRFVLHFMTDSFRAIILACYL